MINNPEELVNKLIELFPYLKTEIEGGFNKDNRNYGYVDPLRYHHIWNEFAPYLSEALKSSNEKIIKKFGEIINCMVAEGGIKENAVSTCILEHGSQIGIAKIIKRFLSKEAKKQLRC